MNFALLVKKKKKKKQLTSFLDFTNGFGTQFYLAYLKENLKINEKSRKNY